MKRVAIPFLVVAASLTVVGMAFALDIPNISTWTQSTGVGGGGPGRGDVLIGALYDVRNLTDANLPTPFQTQNQAQQTLISIVNTDPFYGVVARLRFREWKRSHECLDLDIPLTSNDVWVAEVSRRSTGGPVLNSTDRWISNIPLTPAADFLADAIDLTDFGIGVGNGIPFRAQQILLFEPTLSAADALARCEYGYWEVIGEERFLTITKPTNRALSWTIGRIPLPCANATFDCRDVQDVLMGSAYLIRPDFAISHQYNTNALSDFAVTSAGIYASPLTDLPNLRDSVQGEAVPGAIAPNPGVGGINQLEAILSKRFVMYQYVNGVEPFTNTPQSTSVVVTFPTKWFHFTNTAPTFFNIGATWPFVPPFTANCEVTGDCTTGTGGGEIVNLRVFDREENTFTSRGQIPISPPDIITPGLPRLPYEVNVIGLMPNDPAPIIFRNNVAIPTANTSSGQVFLAGWGWIDLSPNLGFVSNDPRTVSQGESGIIFNFYNNVFPPGPAVPPTPSAYPGAYRGLPAIGIVMTEFFNDTVSGFYGNTVPWQYSVDFGDLPCVPAAACGSGLPPNGAPFVLPSGPGSGF